MADSVVRILYLYMSLPIIDTEVGMVYLHIKSWIDLTIADVEIGTI